MIDLNALYGSSPRPSVVLIGKGVQPLPAGADSNVDLANADELPQGSILTFSLHALTPPEFSRDEQIEVATSDTSFSQALSVANGSITLENARVAVARFDPAKTFGPSAFGPLQFRVTKRRRKPMAAASDARALTGIRTASSVPRQLPWLASSPAPICFWSIRCPGIRNSVIQFKCRMASQVRAARTASNGW